MEMKFTDAHMFNLIANKRPQKREEGKTTNQS